MATQAEADGPPFTQLSSPSVISMSWDPFHSPAVVLLLLLFWAPSAATAGISHRLSRTALTATTDTATWKASVAMALRRPAKRRCPLPGRQQATQAHILPSAPTAKGKPAPFWFPNADT